MFRSVTIPLCIIASSLVASFDLLKVIDRAIEVKMLPNGSYKIGLLTIPVNALCKFPLFITQRLTCHICAADCTTVHNRYSGQCGSYPGKTGNICVCNDAPPADGRVPTAVEQCEPLTIFDIPFFRTTWLLGGAFDTILISFENLALCPLDSTGCEVDCATVHQYDTGRCRDDNRQLGRGKIPDSPQQFCDCQYE